MHARKAAQIPVSTHVFKDLLHYAFVIRALLQNKWSTYTSDYHFVNSISQSFGTKDVYGVLRFVGSAYMRTFVHLPIYGRFSRVGWYASVYGKYYY